MYTTTQYRIRFILLHYTENGEMRLRISRYPRVSCRSNVRLVNGAIYTWCGENVGWMISLCISNVSKRTGIMLYAKLMRLRATSPMSTYNWAKIYVFTLVQTHARVWRFSSRCSFFLTQVVAHRLTRISCRTQWSGRQTCRKQSLTYFAHL